MVRLTKLILSQKNWVTTNPIKISIFIQNTMYLQTRTMPKAGTHKRSSKEPLYIVCQHLCRCNAKCWNSLPQAAKLCKLLPLHLQKPISISSFLFWKKWECKGNLLQFKLRIWSQTKKQASCFCIVLSGSCYVTATPNRNSKEETDPKQKHREDSRYITSALQSR